MVEYFIENTPLSNAVQLIGRGQGNPIGIESTLNSNEGFLFMDLKDQLRHRGFERPNLDVLPGRLHTTDGIEKKTLIQVESPSTTIHPTTDVLADALEDVLDDRSLPVSKAVGVNDVPSAENLHYLLHGEDPFGSERDIDPDDITPSLQKAFLNVRRLTILNRGQSLLDAAGTGFYQANGSVQDATLHFPYDHSTFDHADYTIPSTLEPIEPSYHADVFGVDVSLEGTENQIGIRYQDSLHQSGTLEGIRPAIVTIDSDPANGDLVHIPEAARSDEGYRINGDTVHEGIFRAAEKLDSVVGATETTSPDPENPVDVDPTP